MRRLLMALLAAAVLFGAGGAAFGAPTVRVLRIDGMIHPVTAAILERALEESAREGDDLFLLELDTPGGLVDSTERMIRAMLASPTPICVYVTPRGAHAASAGFFILLAGNVAAMAPVTRTGASSVITIGGENKEGDVALKKASEDLQALLRSLTRAYGRPAEVAEEAVKNAKSWSAEEALEAKLIDLVVPSREELLARLDGREVPRIDGTKTTLRLAGARVVEQELTWSEGFKNVVLHPTIIALLLTIAIIGIYVEFTHPGLILPGVVGVTALLIFLYGSQVLPVRYFAAALVACGVVAFVLELKIVSHGLLTIAGVALTGLGLFLLFPADIPGLAIPLVWLGPLFLVLVGTLIVVTRIVRRALRAPLATGREGLVGELGTAQTDLAPEGRVFVHGETWFARAAETIPRGTPVRVAGSEGLVLVVERADAAPRGAEGPRTRPEGEGND